MTDTVLLEFELKKANISKAEFAKALGISLQALYNKLNNETEFKASEIIKTGKLLNLTCEKRDKIFFENSVA